jgi:hypothetical protein
MNAHDPLLMSDAEILDAATHYSQKDRAAVQRIKCAVQLREPHLTAEVQRLRNERIDADWIAGMEQAA